ncbi:MAG: DUF294 nucleotidyltransferase-like domain-containing protein [Leeuwenhoekiella sp.]
MQNTISERVADFIKRYPPFSFLNKEETSLISENVRVIYLEKGKVIYRALEKNHGQLYMVKDGAVRVFRTDNGEDQTVDICDEGDVFSLRPLITKEDYELTAVANEELILYGIPIDLLLPIALKNTEVSNFLIASFASNVSNPNSLLESGKLFTEYSVERKSELLDLQKAKFSKDPITCKPKRTIQYAANKMSQKRIGSIIILENERPIGIITNKDFRDHIATGRHTIDEPVTAIMSSPVKCFQKDPTVAQAQLIMLRNEISHLCITEDGTPDSPLLGLMTQNDLIVTFANNPVVLIKEVKRLHKLNQLRDIREKITELLQNYLDESLPLSQILNILNEINQAVAVRAIELSLKKMKNPPPCKFAWLALGSQGRKEQLLMTDQDNALVYEDVPEEHSEKVNAYFLELAGHVTKAMHKVGYAYCQADMMASNPRWCQSLSSWREQFKKWIMDPSPESLLLSAIFYDYSYVYGDTPLVTQLTDSVLILLNENPTFYRHMARDAIKSASPLGFFRQFLVEASGEHKDFFDIKQRALMPLIDAARVLSLNHGLRNFNNTAGRFERLAEVEPNNRELYENCSYSFKALLKFRVKQGLIHKDSGRFIELSALSKADKLKLKRCFKPIQDVQELLTLRYSLK